MGSPQRPLAFCFLTHLRVLTRVTSSQKSGAGYSITVGRIRPQLLKFLGTAVARGYLSLIIQSYMHHPAGHSDRSNA